MRTRVIRYSELVLYRTYADLKSEIAKTYLGILWWIIEPVTSMLIYYFVFQIIFKRGTEDFVPFLLIGIVIWRWFASTVQVGSSAIIRNKALVQQAPIHALVYPIVIFLENSVKFVVSLFILLVFLWLYGFTIHAEYALLPVLLLVELLIIFGVMLPLAALVPFLPDITNGIPHILRMGFYGSAVLYPPDMIPDGWRWVLNYNPMALVIQAFRDVLMYNRWPVMPMHVLGAAVFGLVMTLVGAGLIHWSNDIYGKRIAE